MNKLSKRVLSLLLALLMVLGTCDQALAAGLDNGRYTEDSVTELPEPTPEPTAEPTPEPTELPENPEPTKLPDDPEPTELPENPEPTELPENPEPTEKPVVEGEEAVDVAYSDKSEGEYTVAVAEGSYSSDEDVPVLKSVSVTPVEGRTVLEGWTISGNGKDLKLTVSVKTMPALEEGETLALVALNGSVQSSQLKVVTGEGDFASVTVSDSTTGIALVKAAASAAEETPAEKTIETKEQTLPAGNVSINGFLPVGGSVTAVKQGAAKPQMVLKSVNRAASTQSTTSAPAANEKVLASYDITILDENGESWQPEKAVTVTITDDSFGDGKTLQIYHQGSSGREFVATVTSHNNTVSFPAEHFSVYVVVESVVPRLTVKFVNGTTEVATMYVKAEDTEAEVEKIIYDPGAGNTAGQVFKGWTTEQNYTKDTTMMTIVNVRADAMARATALTADGSVTYYAAMFKQYKITYVDGEGITVGSGVAEIPSYQTNASYKVNQGYSTDDSHNFEGWLVARGLSNIVSPADATAETLFKNGTEISIKGDVQFSVSAPEGHWLVFDENGKGATYNAPRFVKKGENTSDEGLLDMVRNGYSFGGWYTDEDCTDGNEFTFGGTINDTTTIYAKWTANATANYTVLIWKQNLAGDGYDFEESISLTGNVNTTVNSITQQGTGNNAYARINGGNKQYTGFHLKEFDQNVTIRPEGNSVVNIYYDRTEYTLTFQTRRYSYSSWNTVKTITAKYGATISDQFPISGYENYMWQSQGGSTFEEGLYIIIADVMPAENVTFHGRNSGTAFKMQYWVQPTSLSTNYNDYELVNTITSYTSDFSLTYEEDFMELSGFTRAASDPAFVNGYIEHRGYGTMTVNFYYNRELYTINFMDGKYVDGNDNPLSEDGLGQIGTQENVAYGSDTTAYNSYVPSTIPTGYVFEGWYIDSECTQKYTFTTMPKGGLTVYAKWRQIQYRVFLHPNAGTDPTLDWGSGSQAMNFRVSYGGKISVPTGMRKGYEFYGWYTDVGTTSAFTENAQIRGGSAYDKTTDFTDPMDRWGNGATTNADVDRFWITEKFDLYGKWSAVTVGAKGIGILYDAGDGSNPPSDTALYKDNTNVTAGAASTAPAGKVFDHWVLQTWNGSAFEDTDTAVIPGGTFTALKANAKITDQAGNVVAPSDVVETGHYNYTIQLKAVYKDKEVETPTHIDWYSNYGSENDGKGTLYHSNTGIKINEAVNILGVQTRPGYTFKGWTKTKGGTTPDFLVWSGSGYTDAAGNAATQVAADEKQPYEDLFAVWEENDVTINYAVASDSTGRGTVAPTSETIKVATGTAAGSTATASSNMYIIDYWTCDDGTVHVGDTATFVPSPNADGIYEAHTYYAHFKLNKAEVTVHHYLKGTTIPVAEDVTTQETIGTEYTAQPVTTYQGKNLTVDSYNPTQPVTIEAEGNVITIYYTLPLTITAKTDSKEYDGSKLTGSFSYVGALDSDKATIEGAFGAPLEIGPNVTSATRYQARTTGIPGYYAITNNPGTLTITPNTDKVTVTITGNHESKVYNAAEQSVTGYTTDVGEKTITVELKTEGKDTAKGTNVGHYVMGLTKDDFTVTSDNYSNIEVVVVDGYLDITPNTDKVTVTITENNGSEKYDGSEKTVTGYTVSIDNELYTEADFEFKGDATVKGTDAGTYNMELKPEDFANTSNNFSNVEFVIVDGTLEIAKRTVTLTSAADKKVYDGTALTNDEVTVGGDGFATGEGAAYDVTGTQTLVGSSANTFTYTLNEGTKAANYDITTTEGKLTVTDGTDPEEPDVPDNKVVTKDDGEDNNKKYHVGETIEWTIWVKNIYDAEKTLTVTETEGMTITSKVPEKLAAGEEITITVQHVVTVADVEAGKITNTVTVKLGELEKHGDDTVTTEKIKITVTAASQTKPYDGTALTNGTFTVTPADPEVPVADGHTVRATVTGSQTEVGSSANVISDYKVTQAVPELDEEGNPTGKTVDVDVSAAYEITTVNGTLTVTTVPYTINYVFTWPGGQVPGGAPAVPAAVTVNRHGRFNVSTATYADIPYGIAPNGNVITVLRFQGWDTGNIADVTSNRTVHGAWTIQMVWYTVTYTDGVPGQVIFPDQVTTTLRIGANTPAFNGTPTREGFNFTGWAPAVSPTVTGNNVYTAQWAPIEEERIVEPTPEPTPVVEEEIIDEEVPQAAPGAAWALINLLAALGTVATAVGMIITFFKKKDEDDDGTKANPDEENDENKGKKSKFLGLIPAVASVIIFILTENMHNPMTLVDKWTIPMVLILAANGIVAYLTRNKKPEDEDTEKAAG